MEVLYITTVGREDMRSPPSPKVPPVGGMPVPFVFFLPLSPLCLAASTDHGNGGDGWREIWHNDGTSVMACSVMHH